VLWCAYRAYENSKRTGKDGSGYAAILEHGVPQVTCFVATGREAWRVTQRAFEEYQ
jgi:hypothetical protein